MTQEQYEAGVVALFKCLDQVETHIAQGNKSNIFADRLTAADIMLYTIIIRFDPIHQ